MRWQTSGTLLELIFGKNEIINLRFDQKSGAKLMI